MDYPQDIRDELRKIDKYGIKHGHDGTSRREAMRKFLHSKNLRAPDEGPEKAEKSGLSKAADAMEFVTERMVPEAGRAFMQGGAKLGSLPGQAAAYMARGAIKSMPGKEGYAGQRYAAHNLTEKLDYGKAPREFWQPSAADLRQAERDGIPAKVALGISRFIGEYPYFAVAGAGGAKAVSGLARGLGITDELALKYIPTIAKRIGSKKALAIAKSIPSNMLGFGTKGAAEAAGEGASPGEVVKAGLESGAFMAALPVNRMFPKLVQPLTAAAGGFGLSMMGTGDIKESVSQGLMFLAMELPGVLEKAKPALDRANRQPTPENVKAASDAVATAAKDARPREEWVAISDFIDKAQTATPEEYATGLSAIEKSLNNSERFKSVKRIADQTRGLAAEVKTVKQEAARDPNMDVRIATKAEELSKGWDGQKGDVVVGGIDVSGLGSINDLVKPEKDVYRKQAARAFGVPEESGAYAIGTAMKRKIVETAKRVFGDDAEVMVKGLDSDELVVVSKRLTPEQMDVKMAELREQMPSVEIPSVKKGSETVKAGQVYTRVVAGQKYPSFESAFESALDIEKRAQRRAMEPAPAEAKTEQPPVAGVNDAQADFAKLKALSSELLNANHADPRKQEILAEGKTLAEKYGRTNPWDDGFFNTLQLKAGQAPKEIDKLVRSVDKDGRVKLAPRKVLEEKATEQQTGQTGGTEASVGEYKIPEAKNIRIRKQADGRYYAAYKGEGTFATGATREEAVENLNERRQRYWEEQHGSADASTGKYNIRPAFLRQPELVQLAKELGGGQYPKIKEALRAARGMAGGVFKHGVPGKEGIELAADIFKEPGQAEATLAHEIGHWIDYVPDPTMKRGNILGHVAGLKRYLKGFLDVGDVFDGETGEIYSKKDITNELKALSKEWRPWDEAKADAEFKAYRNSSKELYADAISVMLNDPAMLKQKAPKFYDAFQSFMRQRPEASDAYTVLAGRLVNGIADTELDRNVNKMLDDADKTYGAKLTKKAEDAHGLNSIGVKLAEALTTEHAAVVKLEREGIKRGLIKAEERPSLDIENMIYTGSQRNQFMQDVQSEVLEPLKNDGIDYRLFRFYVFMKRVASERATGGRADIANPLGVTKDIAQKRIDKMKADMGPQFEQMEQARQKFMEVHQRAVDAAVESGLWSQELGEAAKSAENYATFDVIKFLDNRFGAGIGAKVHKQIGTLSEISDPVAATVMKDLSTIRSANRNIAAKSTVEMMKKVSPELVQPAETKWNGKYMAPAEPRNPEQAMLTFMENGEPVGYCVPKTIAATFERNPLADAMVTKVARNLANPFRWVFTQYNPGFWLFNFSKDYQATVKKTPGMTLALPGVAGRSPLWYYYLRSMGDNMDLARGRANETVQEMRDNNALISVESMRDLDPQDMNIERMQKRWSLNTAEHRTAWQQFGKLFSHIDGIGNFIEAWPKTAAWKYMAEKHPEMPVKERAHFVRAQAGSPPFLIKGRYTPLLNNALIYSNAMAQGWKSDIEAAKRDPVQYGWTTAKLAIAPTLMLAAAAGGVFGKKQKEMIDNIGEYDKTNYTIIPLGMTKTGKTVYLRVPRDETSRFVGGLLWKGMHMSEDGKSQQLFDYTAGQIPQPTPYIEAMADVVQFASGKNPYDAFRGKPAIPERTFEAGGAKALEAFAKYEANNLGLSVVYQFETDDVGKIRGDLEKALRFPFVKNIVGRFIKVTDQGKAEQIRKVGNVARKQETKRQLDVGEAVVQHLEKHPTPDRLGMVALWRQLKAQKKLPQDQTIPQFEKMFDRYRVRREGDPEKDAFVFASSNDEKRAMLEYFKARKTPDEFRALAKDLKDEGLISLALYASVKPGYVYSPSRKK